MKKTTDTDRNGGEVRLKARPVSRGVAIGRIVLLHGNTRQFFRLDIEPSAVESEQRRARAAFRLARRQLNRLQNEPAAASAPGIFEAQRSMIEDSSMLSKVEEAIATKRVNAEWAVKEVTDAYVTQYRSIPDPHLRDRYIDVEDVAERIQNALGGGERSAPPPKDSIIVAKELMPSTLAEEFGGLPTAVITEHGGWTSHTFILARELNLPAVTGVRKLLRRVSSGDMAIVDGYNGRVILNPTNETLDRYRIPAAQFKQLNYNDVTVSESETRTLDGREVILRANVDIPEIYHKAKRYGARGIGLYRSEFLFNPLKGYPTENHQFEAYHEIAKFAGEDGVKIRTFDIGPEKVYGPSNSREKNPALGLRAIRLSLSNVRQFRTQIRALLRASHQTKLDIVIPMVAGVREILEVREIVEKERESLVAKGFAVGEPRVGAMIEVPSAVLLIDELVKESDFFCLGTNDLVQYLLAVDRDNEAVAGWFRTLHPAVLRAIRSAIEATTRAGKPLVVCGEMAGSPYYLPLLVGMGATELSMNVNSLLRVRKIVSGIAYGEAQQLAREIETCRTSDHAEAVVDRHIKEKWSHLIQPDRAKHLRR
ncbi:MAG TPA: phosphoenolpyruvate--protein phosphotransferase [Pyrinomonadaceae bacterium]|nr:phosphoenolpyruvate--protein phosphotransferase [Pyrinomonadaceae bacterium]